MSVSAEELRARLVAVMRRRGLLDDARLADAFMAVPRHLFVPERSLLEAYSDEALVTRRSGGVPCSSSSQPSMMALMLAQLAPQPGDRVLEIGSGTGYNAAVLAQLGVRVTTIEIDPDTAAAARAALADYDAVEVVVGDGGDGHPAGAPYDRIVATAGCASIPAAWMTQLAPGGILVAPLVLAPGVEISMALRHQADGALAAGGGVRCAFMPLRGAFPGGERVPIPDGRLVAALEPLSGAELDLLGGWERPVRLPCDPDDVEDLLLWLAVTGRVKLVQLLSPVEDGAPAWALAVLDGDRSALELRFGPGRLAPRNRAALLGGLEAMATVAAEHEAWDLDGRPGPADLHVQIGGPEPPPGHGRRTTERAGVRWQLWF